MPRIDFRGYSNEALIHGLLAVPDEFRLTDFLNRCTALPIADATFYALHDGRPTPIGDVELALGDVSAVEPTDSGLTAWHSDLRVSTRSVRIEVDAPPYQITGFLHGHVSGDPVESMEHRRAMVPLTNAVIRFTSRGRPIVRSSKVLIINRERALRIWRATPETPARDQALPAPEPSIRTPARRVPILAMEEAGER